MRMVEVRACLLGHGDGGDGGGWGGRDADRNPSLGVGCVTEEELKTKKNRGRKKRGWGSEYWAGPGFWLYHYFPFYFD
jgi:hypothetical protein